MSPLSASCSVRRALVDVRLPLGRERVERSDLLGRLRGGSRAGQHLLHPLEARRRVSRPVGGRSSGRDRADVVELVLAIHVQHRVRVADRLERRHRVGAEALRVVARLVHLRDADRADRGDQHGEHEEAAEQLRPHVDLQGGPPWHAQRPSVAARRRAPLWRVGVLSTPQFRQRSNKLDRFRTFVRSDAPASGRSRVAGASRRAGLVRCRARSARAGRSLSCP